MSMRLKQLESYLSSVDSFEHPNIQLEQVSTSAEIAARMIFVAGNTFDDVELASVGDFGCGPGILGIGASALGCANVLGFDIDEAALETCWVNLRKLEVDNYDIVHSDLDSIAFVQGFDTVFMNPPFGTRIAGIDTKFVLKGMENANVVYSLHKTSTREHFVNLAASNGFKLEVLAEVKYALPKVHKFHKAKSKDIEVDLYRFTHLS